jgi:phosphohistidine swiveling domain-containing protein
MNENQTDLDSHLLSRFETETGEEPERLVVLADRASVDLLPIASRLRPGSAFVFKHASLLAHLSVVLRERGIPAVVIDDDEFFASLLDGRRVQVNAMDSLPDGRARVTLVDE